MFSCVAAIRICSSSLPAAMSAVDGVRPSAMRAAHSRWRVTDPDTPSTGSSAMPEPANSSLSFACWISTLAIVASATRARFGSRVAPVRSSRPLSTHTSRS